MKHPWKSMKKNRKIHDFPSNFQGVKGCHLPSKPSRDQGTLHLRPRCRWGPGSRGRRRSHCPRNDLGTAGIAYLEDLAEKPGAPGPYGDFHGILAMAVGFFGDEKIAEKSPNDFCGCWWSTVKSWIFDEFWCISIASFDYQMIISSGFPAKITWHQNVSSILLNFVAGKSWFLSKPR